MSTVEKLNQTLFDYEKNRGWNWSIFDGQLLLNNDLIEHQLVNEVGAPLVVDPQNNFVYLPDFNIRHLLGITNSSLKFMMDAVQRVIDKPHWAIRTYVPTVESRLATELLPSEIVKKYHIKIQYANEIKNNLEK